MSALPAPPKKNWMPPASLVRPADRMPDPAHPALAGIRMAGAWLAIAAGLATLVALMVPYAAPKLAPILIPALVLLLAGLALLATIVERRGRAAERERLLAENRRLAADLESLADTAWELHESEERAARQKAEAANAAKSRLLATVSHEFRTPLNGILGLTGLLLETRLTAGSGDLCPRRPFFGRGAARARRRHARFLQDRAGRLDLHPEPTDLEALLQEIVELLAARAHAKGIDIAVSMGREVPAEVVVDAARLRQVLLNLAGNGVKFTDAGGVTLSAPNAPAGGRIRRGSSSRSPTAVPASRPRKPSASSASSSRSIRR